MFFRCLLATLVSFTVASPIQAQMRLSPVKIKGKIAAINQGRVLVSTPAGQTWTFGLTPKTQMHIVGMAEPEALVPGVCIHFVGTVDKKQNRVQEKIDAITIFTPGPTADRTLGAAPPNPSAPPPGTIPKEGAPQPQVMPQASGGRGNGIEAFGFDAPGAKPKKTPAKFKDTGPPVEKFDIRGRVVSNKAGRITVSVPTQLFKPKLLVELADNPKIAVDSFDCSLPQVGDLIEAGGRQMAPGMAEATEVRVELMTRLGSGAKKTKKAIAKQSPKKDKDAAADSGQASGEAKPADAKPSPDAPPQNPPVDPAERAKQILAAIELPPNELQGKKKLALNLGGTVEQFTPCKGEPAKNLQDKFGRPEQIVALTGKLPGPDGTPKDIAWQLWIYGPIKLIVDETQTTRYYLLKQEVKPAQ